MALLAELTIYVACTALQGFGTCEALKRHIVLQWIQRELMVALYLCRLFAHVMQSQHDAAMNISTVMHDHHLTEHQ